jgi:nucleotide-binding universal stress UspA family protein
MRILLAVDGSAYSQIAVEEVARRPWPPSSTVRVLAVTQPYTPPATEFVIAGATLEDISRQQTEEAERLTSRVAELVKAADLSVETGVRRGDPRAVIVAEAEDWGADLIVVGSHGRTGVKRWLLGSVAGAIVSHAPCSVEVIRRREPRS